MAHNVSTPSLTVRRVYVRDGIPNGSEISEGDAPMTEIQQDYYKNVIGDGQARVTIGRDMSEMDYGSGGKVFISVSLACDQSAAGIQAAAGLGAQMADYFVSQHYQEMKQRCLQLGLLEVKPVAARPQY